MTLWRAAVLGSRPVTTTPEEDDEDFARMLEESLQPKRFREGDEVAGKVVALGADVAFVDIGGKGEAKIDLEEPADPAGKVQLSVRLTPRIPPSIRATSTCFASFCTMRPAPRSWLSPDPSFCRTSASKPQCP